MDTKDKELLNRIACQDLEAYEMLYDRYSEPIFSLIVRIIKDTQLAEVLLHETFWQIWRTAHQYQDNRLAAAWLFGMARARCLDELRWQRAHAGLSAENDSVVMNPHNLEAQEMSAQSEPEIVLKRKRILEALESIPANQRICLERAYFDGYTQSEIAEIMSVPIDSVKNYMHIGLEKLEQSLCSKYIVN